MVLGVSAKGINMHVKIEVQGSFKAVQEVEKHFNGSPNGSKNLLDSNYFLIYLKLGPIALL